jgi:Glycosyl transferases group 1
VKLTWPVERRALRIAWPTSYEWPPARNWVEPILTGILANGVEVERRSIPQPHEGIVVLEATAGRVASPIVIDYSDRLVVSAGAGAEAAIYFKMQHSTAGYPHENVVPGGYVTASPRVYRYLRALRAVRGRPRFVSDVYGRFGLRSQAETRRRAFEILSGRSDLRYRGSLFRYDEGPEKVPYVRYLREIARSKVCVDLPGKGPLCFRLADYLAVGACVVGPPLAAQLHVPLVNGEHVINCSPDLSDLGEVCARLVRDRQERERIARNARDYFDRYLHRKQLAAYYLSEIGRATS